MFLRVTLFLKENWGTVLILTFFVCWGGFLRLANLGEQSLWIDEGYAINASLSILENGTPTLGSGAKYNAHLFHNYITAGSMKLFGFDPYNPWQARLPAVIFGILSILATYLLTFRITKNKLTALTASFFMAFSYWEIAWSRQARGYTDMQFFILLSYYFFYNWLDVKKISSGILTIIFLLLSYLSHGVALIFIPSFFILFCAHSIWSGKIKEWLSPITIGFFIILTGIATWITITMLPHITTYPYVDKYISFFTGDLKYVSLITLSIVLGLFFWKTRFWRVVYIIGIILPTAIIIVFYSQVIQMRYLLTIFPFLLIAGSYGTYLLVVKKEYMKSTYRVAIYLLIVGGIASTMTVFIPQNIYNLEIGSPQPNFKKAYSTVQTIKTNEDLVISPYTHLSKIYLNDRGLWLPISLTGRTSEIAANTINGGDYYTGAPIIPNKESLDQILNTYHGYIIIDDMARIRLKDTFTFLVDHSRVAPAYYEKTETGETIAVYGFGIGENNTINCCTPYTNQ